MERILPTSLRRRRRNKRTRISSCITSRARNEASDLKESFSCANGKVPTRRLWPTRVGKNPTTRTRWLKSTRRKGKGENEKRREGSSIRLRRKRICLSFPRRRWCTTRRMGRRVNVTRCPSGCERSIWCAPCDVCRRTRGIGRERRCGFGERK